MDLSDTTKVQTHFDQRTATYSNLFDNSVRDGVGHKFRCRRDLIETLLAGKKGRLLDCATGTGEVTLAGLLSGDFDSAAINDYSNEMLARSRSRIESASHSNSIPAKIEFSHANAFDLEGIVASSSIDTMLCLGLIAHVGRLEGMLGLANRLLTDTGQLLFQTSLLDHLGVRLIKRLSERRHIKANGDAVTHYLAQGRGKSCKGCGVGYY